MIPDRYDMSIPGNQRKLEAADALARLAEEAGITLIEMAIAFVIRHPAVTAAIIGPRTMEHLESQLAAADVTLSDDVLDRIDEIVPPGTNVNPGDSGWENPDLRPEARRRACGLAPVVGQRRQPDPVDEERLDGQPGVERPRRDLAVALGVERHVQVGREDRHQRRDPQHAAGPARARDGGGERRRSSATPET